MAHPTTLARRAGADVKWLSDDEVAVALQGRDFSDRAMFWTMVGYGRELVELDLSQSTVTDEHLEQLQLAPRLRVLNLADTEITHDAAQAFQDQHPDCRIVTGTTKTHR
jgi:hypothetical protein